MRKNLTKSEIGATGVQLVADELLRRGYNPTIMPNHNVGFDLTVIGKQQSALSEVGSPFATEVEVKFSTSSGTQVPLQIRTHLECPVRNRVYVLVRMLHRNTPEFFIMTHQEIQKAWEQMPKIKPSGEPYVIRGTGYIDWSHIQPHKDCWNKLATQG